MASIIAIMQPYLFPYFGYFQLIEAVDKFVIYDDVNYIKKGWINRNKIIINGNEHLFTMPLIGASQNVPINQLMVGGVEYTKWRIGFIRTLEMGFKHAPYRENVIDLVDRVLPIEGGRLADILLCAIKEVLQMLQIGTEIIPSAQKYGNMHLKAAERIVDICKKEKCDTYVNMIGGRDLYRFEYFRENDLQLRFLRTSADEVLPMARERRLCSILELMMWISPEELNGYIKEYKLISE